MITVKLKKTAEKSLSGNAANAMSVGYYNYIKKLTTNQKCTVHTDVVSRVFVTAAPNKSPMLSVKREFCCAEFESKFDFKQP